MEKYRNITGLLSDMHARIDVLQRLTIADIAAAAGVSLTTVSRVLNQRPDVSPETRERVLHVIAEHGYVGTTIHCGG